MIDMYVAQNQDIAHRVIDDETIILTPEDGMLHNLNPVATRIFELADGKRRIRDIIAYICEEFEVEENVAQKDTINFIQDSIHKKFLLLSDEPLIASK